MRRLLAAAAVSAGLVVTIVPAAPANACAFSQCPWGQVVCSAVSCPIFCTDVPVADRRVCIAR